MMFEKKKEGKGFFWRYQKSTRSILEYSLLRTYTGTRYGTNYYSEYLLRVVVDTRARGGWRLHTTLRD